MLSPQGGYPVQRAYRGLSMVREDGWRGKESKEEKGGDLLSGDEEPGPSEIGKGGKPNLWKQRTRRQMKVEESEEKVAWSV
ncbi:hypothetical protein NDU88_000248 [Pleurodeles waltl]|uniref:Uncharacterized protein n=1 Tax=Pleurodeles waltl TaxID=8319 RepID=A0AAV7S6J0_PLEWA|nr:hypothetical protein NDU88_000248 [Pleurodeles waltl]